MKEIKLAIIGSRNFNNYSYLKEIIDILIKSKNWKIIEIVSGGAKGTDTLAWRYAILNKIKLIEYKPDWSLGKAAGMIRNTSIIEHADIVIAFQLLKSKGTQDSINKCIKAGKEVIVINCDNIPSNEK